MKRVDLRPRKAPRQARAADAVATTCGRRFPRSPIPASRSNVAAGRSPPRSTIRNWVYRSGRGFRIPVDESARRGIGGAERDRTVDLLIANEALSQLSYSPTGPEEARIIGAGLGVSSLAPGPRIVGSMGRKPRAANGLPRRPRPVYCPSVGASRLSPQSPGRIP